MSAPQVPGRLWRACCPGWLLRAWAARERAAGHYTRTVLAACWVGARRGGPAAWLQYLLFRRDLGRPLPRRWRARLQAALPTLSPASQLRARALLAEVDAAPRPALAVAPGVEARRQVFARWLDERRAGGACLVGNAASLAGQGLGAAIDAQGVVWRFNRWPTDRVEEVGARCDVWVVSPDLDMPLPVTRPAWVLLSGPDPAQALLRWPLGERLAAAGVPVLTVPLSVWGALVRQLQAPPSAGLLALAWLRCLSGDVLGWRGLSAPGIGVGQASSPGEAYHLGDPQARPGRRHAWAREAALVVQWRQAGLSDRPVTPAGRRLR